MDYYHPSVGATGWAEDPYQLNPSPSSYHAPHVNPNNPDASAENTNIFSKIQTQEDLPWVITYFIQVLWDEDAFGTGTPNPFYMPDIEIGFVGDMGIKDRHWTYYGWQGAIQYLLPINQNDPDKVGDQYTYSGTQWGSSQTYNPVISDSYYFRGPHGIKFKASAYENSNGPQDAPAVDSGGYILFEKTSLGSGIPGYTGPSAVVGNNLAGVTGAVVKPLGGFTGTTGYNLPYPAQSGPTGNVNPCCNLYQALHYVSDINKCLGNTGLCPWNATDKRIITIVASDSEGGNDGYVGEIPLGGNAVDFPNGKNPTLNGTLPGVTGWSPPAPDLNKTIRGTFLLPSDPPGLGQPAPFNEADINTPNHSGLQVSYPRPAPAPPLPVQRGFGANCSNQDYFSNLWYAFTPNGEFTGGLPEIKQGIPSTSALPTASRNKQATARGKWGITSSKLHSSYELNTAQVPGSTGPAIPNGTWFWGNNVGPSFAAYENYNLGSGSTGGSVIGVAAPIGPGDCGATGVTEASDVPKGGGGISGPAPPLTPWTAYMSAVDACGPSYTPALDEGITGATGQYWLWNYCFSKSAQLKNNSSPYFVPYNQNAMYSIENASLKSFMGYFDKVGSPAGTGNFFGYFPKTIDFKKWLDVVQEKTTGPLFPTGMNNILMYDAAFLPNEWINESISGVTGVSGIITATLP